MSDQVDHDETVEIQQEAERRHTMATSKKGATAVIKEGELQKLGGFMKNWKKRFFVLLHDSIAYFDHKDGKIKGGVLIESIKGIREATELECKKPNTMAIETTVGRTFLFHGETKEIIAEWMEAIGNVWKKAKGSDSNSETETKTDTETESKADTKDTEAKTETKPEATAISGSMGTLYTNPVSPNGVVPFALLNTAGVDYEFNKVDLAAGQTRTPEYLEMNPMHSVPLFKGSDGFCIFESNAILRYLCQKNPEKLGKYYPTDVNTRAVVDMALDFRQTSLYEHASKLAYPYLGFGVINDEVQAKALANLTEISEGLKDGPLSILENYFLKDKKFVVGAQVTIADFSIRGLLMILQATKGKKFELTFSDRLSQYISDFDAATSFEKAAESFNGYVAYLASQAKPDDSVTEESG